MLASTNEKNLFVILLMLRLYSFCMFQNNTSIFLFFSHNTLKFWFLKYLAQVFWSVIFKIAE